MGSELLLGGSMALSMRRSIQLPHASYGVSTTEVFQSRLRSVWLLKARLLKLCAGNGRKSTQSGEKRSTKIFSLRGAHGSMLLGLHSFANIPSMIVLRWSYVQPRPNLFVLWVGRLFALESLTLPLIWPHLQHASLIPNARRHFAWSLPES